MTAAETAGGDAGTGAARDLAVPSGPRTPPADREEAPAAVPPVLTVLSRGELTVRGRIGGASNAVLYCTATHEGHRLDCVYKPVAGERPLWDFPDGNLARREVAAYEVSLATGWDLVPPTVLRDGPHGEGMCQLWVGPPGVAGEEVADPDTGASGGPAGDGRSPAEEEPDADERQLLALVDGEPGDGWKPVGHADVGEGRTALLVHADDPVLRRIAVLDAVINNSDRKGGHLLFGTGGRLWGIDHGVTFHVDDKLRTLLWGWAGEELTAEATAVLRRLSAALADGAPLATRLAELITQAELEAVRKRTGAMLSSGRHPLPSGDWPAIPWPPV